MTSELESVDGREVAIAPVSWGLGDLVVSLPAVQSLIDNGFKTYLVTRSDLQEELAQRMLGLAGTITESEFTKRREVYPPDYLNLRDHPLQTDFWWGSAQFEEAHPGLKINQILSQICQDKGLNPDFSILTPLDSQRNSESEGKVVLIPGSDGTHKCWPKEHWLELTRLLESSHLDTMVVGQPSNSRETEQLIGAGVPWIETRNIAEAIDVLSSAKAVIAVDTGLMHVAVTQGVPTICLFKAPAVYLREYAHVRSFVAPECSKECQRRFQDASYNETIDFDESEWVHEPWTCAENQDKRCMARISSEGVFSALLKLIAGPVTTEATDT